MHREEAMKVKLILRALIESTTIVYICLLVVDGGGD